MASFEDKDWVNEEDLMALRMNRQYLVGLQESGPSQAMNILREASPAAAMEMVKLALHADSETVRLRASQYILDKTIGDGGEGANPWDDIVGATVKDIEQFVATQPPSE
jgi:hypothetical protein